MEMYQQRWGNNVPPYQSGQSGAAFGPGKTCLRTGCWRKRECGVFDDKTEDWCCEICLCIWMDEMDEMDVIVG